MQFVDPFFLFMSALCGLHAEDVSSAVTTQRYEYETVGSLGGNGHIVLRGTHVMGGVSLNGDLRGEDASIEGKINVHGSVNLENCHLYDTATVNGHIHVKGTVLRAPLHITSHAVELRNCELAKLVVRPIPGSREPQVIHLRDHTIIFGDVIVESGEGEIWLSQGSEILGRVHGAQVHVQ